MGFSLSWAAVKGGTPAAVPDALSLQSTGATEEIPESEITAAQLPGAWYMIVSQDDSLEFANDKTLERLSTFGEIVTCFVEEHRAWSIDHDCDGRGGIYPLDIKGEPPSAFAGIRDRLRSKQETAGGKKAGVDYIFDVPVELARSVTGYRHDQDIPELRGVRLEVLARTQPVPKQSWFRKLLPVLLVASLALPAMAGQKKLIQFGIASPDSVWMKNHILNMEEAPFDGTVFYLTTDAGRARGVVGDFSWGAFGTRQFSKKELQSGIDALKATKSQKLTDNFARVCVTALQDLTDKRFVDWFDSFDVILHNMALAATAVKEGEEKGLLFDVEAYAGPLWDYKKQRDASTKSFEQYAIQVRLRGKQVMNAFQSAYPGIIILLAEGYTLPYRDAWPWPYQPGTNSFPENSGHPDKLKHIPYGLLAPFLDGMGDAAAPTTRIIDGGEGTYTHRTKKDFARFRKGFETGVLPMVGITREKYHKTFTLALATWIDVNWRQENGWNATDFKKNFWQPADLQAALENALDESDEYVWLYAESLYFWGPSRNVPEAYQQAVDNAHRRASGNAAR